MKPNDSAPTTIFYGQVVTPKSLLDYDAFVRAVLAVGSNGNILWIEPDVGEERLKETINSRLQAEGISLNDVHLRRISDSQFLMPGFIDTHTVSL